MLAPKRYLKLLSFAFFFCSLFIYYRSSLPAYLGIIRSGNDVSLLNHVDTIIEPANSTLGFGAIYVVSASDSPRRTKLIQAANVTEIDLVIPELTVWTDEDEMSFRSGLQEENRGAGHGSIMAWLSHIHLLKL